LVATRDVLVVKRLVEWKFDELENLKAAVMEFGWGSLKVCPMVVYWVV